MFTLWTEDADVARPADEAGIDRIGVDLERLGKALRPKGCDTWISSHTAGDLRDVRSAIGRAQAFARINPISDTPREIDAVLSAGAQVLMLPMTATACDVREFVQKVDGRALVVLLIERREEAAGPVGRAAVHAWMAARSAVGHRAGRPAYVRDRARRFPPIGTGTGKACITKRLSIKGNSPS